MQNIKAIVFDIDGTLTETISWLALTKQLGASVDAHKDIYEQYKTSQITYEESKEQLLNLWHHTGNANRSSFTAILERIPLRTDTEQTVDYLQGKGYVICLITGSMDLYAKIVADKLGVKDYYANTLLEFDGSDTLTDYEYKLNQAEVKKEQFLDFCANHKLAPEVCAVVGDSENDYELFKLSGNGVLLQTELAYKDLETVAAQHITNLLQLQGML